MNNRVLSFQVLYFAAIREFLGLSEEKIQWDLSETVSAETSTLTVSVQQLSDFLVQRHPKLTGQLASVRFAVNEEFVELSGLVGAGDTVAIIPPVSGG